MMKLDILHSRSSVPLPLGERWLGAAESVRGNSPLSLKPPFEHSSHGLLALDRSAGAISPAGRLAAPHPALRATFSPRGRRMGPVVDHSFGACHV